MSRSVSTIGIVGGGTAGYLAALYLKRSLPGVEVTVIESSTLPVIGVGESTTPLLLHFLHTKMGFPVDEFFTETKPTLKLGVRLDWGLPGDYHFNSTFGYSWPADALAHSGEFNDLSLASLLMESGRAPMLTNNGSYQFLGRSADVAYHIDNRRFLAYLKRKLLALGCRWLDRDIAGVLCTADGGEVASLETTTGETLSFDLFIDCSGFVSLLLGKAMHAPWVSYGSSLKTDRAVIGQQPSTDDFPPYTTARTLNHGWLWNTPMQQENHLGYVFCSAFCTDEEARAELRRHCSTVNHERVIHFRTGRYRESWIGNVVAIGNAFAFIEPLESTAIHMILTQLKYLAGELTMPASADGKAGYNDRTNTVWDHLRWFIAIHYRFNRQLDTPFWQHCRETVDVSGVSEYLDHFMQHGPLAQTPGHPLYKKMDCDSIFSVFSFDTVLAGCGVQRDRFRDHESFVNPEWPMVLAMHRSLAARAVPHRQALSVLEQGGPDLLRARAPGS